MADLVCAYSYGLLAITTRTNNVYCPHQFRVKLMLKYILLAMRGDPMRSTLCSTGPGRQHHHDSTREHSVVDATRHICGLFVLNPSKAIWTVSDLPFNDHRYFIDHQKLKLLG